MLRERRVRLVRAVSGLDTSGYEHPYELRSTTIGAVIRYCGRSSEAGDGDQLPNFFSSQCFTGTETETYSNNDNGSLPIGTYTGNKIESAEPDQSGCAYTPPVVQTAYNLTGLYNEHGQYEGTDQTIAIIDWCGSPTILADVNAFSAQFGLPKLIPYSQIQQPFLEVTYTAPSTCDRLGQRRNQSRCGMVACDRAQRQHQSGGSSVGKLSGCE